MLRDPELGSGASEKHELPEERQSRFSAFALGAAAYAALLLAI